MSDEDRYLDPRFNPMIPCDDSIEPLKPGDEGFDGSIPMSSPADELLQAMISEHLGEAFEAELGSHRIKKMADDSFRVDDRALSELSAELRREIERELFSRKR
jgi:hypothetical protein